MSPQEVRARSDAAARRAFILALRRALHHLYDVVELRKSPLCALFSLGEPNDAAALRHILEEAIGALKPAPGLSPQSDAWRTYRVLYHRYVEQFDQTSVAVNLGLSIRQLRRQEQLALQTLADWLVQRYRLDLALCFGGASSHKDAEQGKSDDGDGDDAPAEHPDDISLELKWAERFFPNQPVDVAEIVRSAVQTARPVADAQGVTVHSDLPATLPHVLTQPASARQVLLNLLITAIRADERVVRIACSQRGAHVHVAIGPIRRRTEQDAERLTIAEHLAVISGGHLEYCQAGDSAQTALLALPLAGQVPVLVIDDNADSLQLFERCLANSPYRFVGARHPEQAIGLAERVRPAVIVLDVMLPQMDGWETLGRLREHPATCHIPVVICTILPQEELAATLGAASFIRKPVTRERLLQELDRQTRATATGCGLGSPHTPAVDAATAPRGA